MSPTVSLQQDRRRFVYCIDADDRVAFVNEAWLAFARENGAMNLTAEALVHQPLWRFITDREVIHLYKILLERVRSGEQLRLPFRCDAPDCRRFMQLRVYCQDGEVCFESHILRQEWRAPVALLKPDEPRSQELLRMCSWCKKIRVKGRGWMEVERAVKALRLFDTVPLPQLTHGMCPLCYRQFIRQLPGHHLRQS